MHRQHRYDAVRWLHAHGKLRNAEVLGTDNGVAHTDRLREALALAGVGQGANLSDRQFHLFSGVDDSGSDDAVHSKPSH